MPPRIIAFLKMCEDMERIFSELRGEVSELERLRLAIDKNPEDWDLRRVLADWYEENQEQNKADCQRWMADNRKRACFSSPGCYHWYITNVHIMSSELPVWLFHCFDGGQFTYVVRYETIRNAEDAIMKAWEIAIQKGWKV